MFLTSVGTSVQVIGALGGGTSAITILLATIVFIIIEKNEVAILAFASARITSPAWKARLRTWWARIAFLLICGILLFLLTSVSSVLTYVRPDAFAGWTPGSPFRFGRHVTSISRQVLGQEQYCAQAHITGDLGNTTNGPLRVYNNGPVRVWSTGPAASFDLNVAIDGVATGGGPTVIGPGDSVPVTITASVAPDNCRSYTASSLADLRSGRLNASGTLVIKASNNTDTQTAFRFEALPIAQGGS